MPSLEDLIKPQPQEKSKKQTRDDKTTQQISQNLSVENPEHLETETLKTEIEELVKDKQLKNYPGSTLDYLHSIYANNKIFTKRDGARRVTFLKQVKKRLMDPSDIAGIDF